MMRPHMSAFTAGAQNGHTDEINMMDDWACGMEEGKSMMKMGKVGMRSVKSNSRVKF